MNGWHIYDRHTYTTADITHDAAVQLKRSEEIKFDVEIEDVE